MPLTTAQQATLKAAILADQTLNAFPNTSDGNTDMSFILNANATPTFTVWRTNVSKQVVFSNFEGSAYSGLTTANTNRLIGAGTFCIDGFNPSSADVRFLFDDIFSGASGATTRTRLLALWKRPALLIEKILATGTGTDIAPATMGYEGNISVQDIQIARSS